MKVCNYCGTGMDNNAVKCPFCGQPMDVKGAIRFQNNEPWNGDTSVFSTLKYEGKTRAELMVEESDRKKKFQDLFKKREASLAHPEHDRYSAEEQKEYRDLKEETSASSDKTDWSEILTSATGKLLGQEGEAPEGENGDQKKNTTLETVIGFVITLIVIAIGFIDC